MTLISDGTLVPFKESLYAAVAVVDVDRDGLPDLYRGSSEANGSIKIYRNMLSTLHFSTTFEERCGSQATLSSSTSENIGRFLQNNYGGPTLNNLQLPYGGLDAFVPLPGSSSSWCGAHFEEKLPAQHLFCDSAHAGGVGRVGYSWQKDHCTNYALTLLDRCLKCWELNGDDCDEEPSCLDVDLLGDVDGDGLVDLFTQKYSWWGNYQLSGAEFHYSGVWGGASRPLAVPARSSIKIKQSTQTNLADYNGDGFADLMTGTDHTTLGVWYGTGDGNFTCTPSSVGAADPCTFHADDLVSIPTGVPGKYRGGMPITGVEDLGGVAPCVTGQVHYA